jgi:hypothetical protein
MNAFVGWVLIAAAAALPGIAALLFGWDRITLSKQYFWLGIAVAFLWPAVRVLGRRVR